ncbi:MAG: transposase [Sulfurovum sp.]|nr:transposase [Sulfurovum sp.]MCB4782526.1 transposase [Sulfurovum sp.]
MMKVIGSEASASPKDAQEGGTEVPLPSMMSPFAKSGSEALASPKDVQKSRTEVPLMKKKHSHLPHVDAPGYYQFVTFRTHDSIDDYIQRVISQKFTNKKKQYLVDQHLDTSPQGRYLNGRVQQYLYEFFLEQNGELYELVAFVIMPNHVHMLFKPNKPLAKVMQAIKGVTSKQINVLLEQKGKFWASDYYDKAIRNQDHFDVVYRYIKNNPLKLEDGTKVPFPKIGSEASASHKDVQEGGTEVPLPEERCRRFYGIYEMEIET